MKYTIGQSIVFCAMAMILFGCQGKQSDWIEQKCLHAGLEPGTEQFELCKERDQNWEKKIRRPQGGP